MQRGARSWLMRRRPARLSGAALQRGRSRVRDEIACDTETGPGALRWQPPTAHGDLLMPWRRRNSGPCCVHNLGVPWAATLEVWHSRLAVVFLRRIVYVD